MGKRDNILILVFGALFLLSVIMIFNQGAKTTGYATASTESNVTITSYFAIAMSENLSNGIEFGSIATLPSANVNASDNNNSGSGGSTMWMNVSADSNTAVDFCIKADSLNTSANDIIGLANETYDNATLTNITRPELNREAGLTTSYVKAGAAIAAGGTNYYRFWLDVPAATVAGVYNNTVTFEGVQTTLGC
jgi:hypothetical protein